MKHSSQTRPTGKNTATSAIILLFLALNMSAFAVFAEGTRLGHEELTKVFTNTSFDGLFIPKNKRFTVFGASDGTLHILRPNGKRDKGRTWYISDAGQRCATSPKWNEARCFDVFDAGNGTYHQFKGDKHLHTFTNFRTGNHLD